MDSPIKICPHCQTINEPDYVYCKRCGTALPSSPPAGPGSAQPDSSFSGAYAPQGAYGPSAAVDGIPAEQINAFIGNNPSLQNKIHKMSLTHSKASWNWPVFLTAFFGGPLIAPCWFFHRKMNKIAAILLVAGIVFTLLSLLVLVPVMESSVDMIQEIVVLTKIANNPNSSWFADYSYEQISRIVSEFMQTNAGYFALSSLLSMLQLAYAIVISLFANSLYKGHITKTITAMASLPGGITGEALAARGGTAIAGWIILGAATLVLSGLLSVLSMQYIFSNILSYFS